MSPSRHPSTRRAPEQKKEAEDVFVEKVLSFGTWAKENSQILILLGIVVVVMGAGLFYYSSYRRSVERQAIAQLEQVQQTVAFGDRESAKTTLQQYVERFDGTAYALEARLLLGQVLLEEGDSQGAIDALAPAVRTMDSQPLGIQAAFLMASGYETVGRLEDAERLLQRVASTAELPFQVRQALAGAARLKESRGDWAGALELYDDLLADMTPTDPERNYFEMRRAEAAAHLG